MDNGERHEDESDDDVSLLAITPESEADEEDELDDKSLLDAGSPDTDGMEVDYLEGMTPEIFGGDEAFDACDEHKEQEEVEALPDAHYGLLGSSGVLDQPQGHIEDLPEEVLWQVLCQVPAQDLYRSVSLVSHRWRNIVLDPEVKQLLTPHSDITPLVPETCNSGCLFQFVPYKKQYYRYMMGEKETVEEIRCTLNDSGIINHPDHRIRKLVV